MITWRRYVQLRESNAESFMGVLKAGAGWIDHRGELHPCPSMTHHRVLEGLPVFADLIEEYPDKQDRWEAMTKRAYQLGFVRVVLMGGDVYAEGQQQAIARNRRNLKDLAAHGDGKVVPTYRNVQTE